MTREESAAAATTAESCSVLIADDDEGLCASLRDVLELRRHSVDVAHSGAEALAACARSTYDVLLLDVSLPDVSGLDLISRVEEIRPDLDLLIITGHASLNSAVQAVSRSTVGYLIKPLDLDRLLEILQGIAQRKLVAKDNRRLIEQLERKNAELERYAYTVSHDLTSPLITISGFLSLVEQSARRGDLEQLESDLDRIRSAANRMKELLDKLLELSRIGRVANPSVTVSVRELVQDAVDLVSQPRDGPRVEIAIGENLGEVRCDRVRLLEVFQNLVENAVKFMGDQPRPRVEIGTRAARGGGTVYFVSDNGIGIDARHLERVFGLFDKVAPDSAGTGIGLALVRRIVEDHGGRIWVESGGAGRGSTFSFTLGAGSA